MRQTVYKRAYNIKCNTWLNEEIFQYLLKVKPAILRFSQRGMSATQLFGTVSFWNDRSFHGIAMGGLYTPKCLIQPSGGVLFEGVCG